MGKSAVAPPSSTAKRSIVMVARISFVFQTKRIPARSEYQVAAVNRRSATRGLTEPIKAPAARQQAAVPRYAPAARPVAAMTSPPIAGPATDAICQPLLFQVTALLRISGGTIWGTRDQRAG